MKRQSEYFSKLSDNKIKYNILHAPRKVFCQERDWTCSIACIRSLLSGVLSLEEVPDEGSVITRYKLQPGPYYSKDIKEWGIFDDLAISKVIYGCDFAFNNTSQEDILRLLNRDFYIMVESMINYSHWLVLLGFTCADDREHCQVLSYDPYYNKMRVDIADEFFSMWHDGDHEKTGIHHDFIAIR